MAHVFSNETDANRYAMHEGDQLVGVLDYSILGNEISLTRSFTTPPFRGHGYAGELVSWAVDQIEKETTYRVVPLCWYVGVWFEKHPERAGLLNR